MSNLHEVKAAQQRANNANHDLYQTIADAIDGGVPIAKICRTLGVSRYTIDTWLKTLNQPQPTKQP